MVLRTRLRPVHFTFFAKWAGEPLDDAGVVL